MLQKSSKALLVINAMSTPMPCEKRYRNGKATYQAA